MVGKLAEREALLDLTPAEERDAADVSLSSLVRRDLLRPERVPAGDAYAFRHVLLRDAAYDSLPKQERAELHERHAAWLERSAGAEGHEERVAFHLEAAVLARLALGPLDVDGCRLARRAAVLLAPCPVAGWQNRSSRHERGPHAVPLLGRRRLASGSPRRSHPLVDWHWPRRQRERWSPDADHRSGRLRRKSGRQDRHAREQAMTVLSSDRRVPAIPYFPICVPSGRREDRTFSLA